MMLKAFATLPTGVERGINYVLLISTTDIVGKRYNKIIDIINALKGLNMLTKLRPDSNRSRSYYKKSYHRQYNYDCIKFEDKTVFMRNVLISYKNSLVKSTKFASGQTECGIGKNVLYTLRTISQSTTRWWWQRLRGSGRVDQTGVGYAGQGGATVDPTGGKSGGRGEVV